MTNTIGCIEKADVILITGSNTTENHPVISSYVKRAVTLRGAKLIVVDPRRIKITQFANHWLRQNRRWHREVDGLPAPSRGGRPTRSWSHTRCG